MKSLSQHITESQINESFLYDIQITETSESKKLIKQFESKTLKKLKAFGNLIKIVVKNEGTYRSKSSGLKLICYFDTKIVYTKAFDFADRSKIDYNIEKTTDVYSFIDSDNKALSGGFSEASTGFEINSKILEACKYIVKSGIVFPGISECQEIDELLLNKLVEYDPYVKVTDQVRIGGFTSDDKYINTNQIAFKISKVSNLASLLRVTYNFVAKSVEIEFGAYISNTNRSFEKKSLKFPIKQGSILDNLKTILSNKSIKKEIVDPIIKNRTFSAQALGDFYRNRHNAD